MTEHKTTQRMLEQVCTEFEQDNHKATVRAKTWIVVRIVLILFVAGYMSWIFSAISQLDAQELTRIAAASIEEKLPQFRADLRDFAIEKAPDLTNQARDLLLQVPAHLRESIEAQLLDKTTDLIVSFERDLNGALTSVIDDQIELLEAESPNSNPEELLDAIILGVSDDFRRTMTEALDAIYDDYTEELDRLNARLDHLLRDVDLTESEKIDKKLIEAWMVLVHRHDFVNPERLFKDLQVSY